MDQLLDYHLGTTRLKYSSFVTTRPFAGAILKMGTYDSFYDEDSTCPKCKAKIGWWQTKSLDSRLQTWKKGEFVQYRKYKRIPEKERRTKDRDWRFAPILRQSDEYASDAPLLNNGRVPVYMSCDKCKAWLQAYAKIRRGRFVGIVEVQADRKERRLVLDWPDDTAKDLRDEFRRRMYALQESCKHEKSEWRILGSLKGPGYAKGLVCLRCEKILKMESAERRLLSEASGTKTITKKGWARARKTIRESENITRKKLFSNQSFSPRKLTQLGMLRNSYGAWTMSDKEEARILLGVKHNWKNTSRHPSLRSLRGAFKGHEKAMIQAIKELEREHRKEEDLSPRSSAM